MKQFCKLLAPLLTAVVVFLYATTATPVYAVSGSVYFSPHGATHKKGTSFTVEVRGDVPSNGWLGGGATIGVTYPSSLLQVTDTSASGGALGGSKPTVSGGTVSYSVFNYPSRAVNNQKIFSITFKAVAAGKATLNFTSNSNINDGPTSKRSSTFVIQNPTCPSGQIGTPPNCRTPAPDPTPPPATNPTPTPKPQVTQPPATPENNQAPQQKKKEAKAKAEQKKEPLEIDNVEVAHSYDSATFSWETTDKTTGTLQYGLSETALEQKPEVSSEKDGELFRATLSNLQLGTTYYYAITAKDASGGAAAEKGSFTTKAYPVVLRVTQDDKPAADANITIKDVDEKISTDTKGEASLELMPGSYILAIEKGKLKEQQKFSIKKLDFTAGSAPDTQVIDVKIASVTTPSSSTNYLPVVVGITFLLALLSVAAWWFFVHRRTSSEDTSGYQSLIEFDTPLAPQAPTGPAQSYYDSPPMQPVYDPASTAPAAYNTIQPPASYSPQPATLPTYVDGEPVDIWAEATTPEPLQQYTSAPTAQQPGAVEPYETPVQQNITPSTPNGSEELYTQPTPQQPAIVQEIPDQYQQPEPATAPQTTSQTDSLQSHVEYEFGDDDNSLTIHHST